MTGSGEPSSESKMKSSVCPLLMKLGTKGLNTPESHSLWKKSKGRLNPATSALWLQLGHRAWPGFSLRSGTHRTFPPLEFLLVWGLQPVPGAGHCPEHSHSLSLLRLSHALRACRRGGTLLASVPPTPISSPHGCPGAGSTSSGRDG